MNPRRIYSIFIRQYYLTRDNPTRFSQLFIWVLLDIVLWGFLTKYLASFVGTGVNVATILLGAILLWDFLTRVMNGVTLPFFEDVWSRNFLNLFASPLSISEYITGLVISAIITSVFGLIAMLLLASVFGFTILTYGILAAPYIFVLFLCGISLGICGVAIVLRYGPSAEWFIWPIPTILSPFAGVLYPLSILPQWMRLIGYALPPSYVFDGMRTIVAGGTPAFSGLAIAAVLSVVYLFLSYFVFVRVYKSAVRSGLIAHYSVETV